MNKREVIAEIKKIKREEHEKAYKEALAIGNASPLATSATAYERAKKLAEDNGYVDECFVQLWNKATSDDAKEMGIYERDKNNI